MKSIFITSSATVSPLSSQAIDNTSDSTSSYFSEINLFGGICKIVVKKASLYKCPRCWNYNAQIEGGLCKRCENVLITN